jgi:hypothetical protein
MRGCAGQAMQIRHEHWQDAGEEERRTGRAAEGVGKSAINISSTRRENARARTSTRSSDCTMRRRHMCKHAPGPARDQLVCCFCRATRASPRRLSTPLAHDPTLHTQCDNLLLLQPSLRRGAAAATTAPARRIGCPATASSSRARHHVLA